MTARLCIALLFAAAMALGCNDSSRKTSVERSTGPANADKTPGGSADTTVVTKEEYEQQLDRDLRDLDRRMGELAQRIDKAQGDAKDRLKEEWDKLEPERERAKVRLEELKKSSGEAWKDLKSAAQSAFSEFREGVDRASQRFDKDEK